MGVRFPSVATTTILANVPASGADTVILTTPPLNLPLDGALVFLHWNLVFGTGAGTVSVLVSLRRGTTTAAAKINVGSLNITVTAATEVNLSGVYVDSPGAVAEQQYSVSLLGNATTGAMTNSDGALIAMVL